MRYQGICNDKLGVSDEMESSAFVALDRDPLSNPAIFVDCSDEPSRTRQEFAAEADINNLMAQYEKSGILPTVNRAPPEYLDVSNVPDFQTALDFVHKATEAFMTIPAAARALFENSPANFIMFAENPDNLDQMRAWGLAPPKPADPLPTKVEIINPPEKKDA